MASPPLSKITLAALIAVTAACSGKSDAPASGAAAPPANAVTSLQSETLKPGTGDAIAAGKIAVVPYTGWLYEAGAADY